MLLTTENSLQPVSFTLVVNLVLRISSQIFEYILYGANDGIIRDQGEADLWKVSWNCPLKLEN